MIKRWTCRAWVKPTGWSSAVGSRRNLRAALASGCGAALLFSTQALAGPPYVTDDPEPTAKGHWEDYTFASGTNVPGQTQGAGGLDLNYGAAKDLQLSAVLSLGYSRCAGYRVGLGDLELGAKYRFVHQTDGGWLPDVSVFPALDLPTGARAFGTGHASLSLPIWMEKDFGKWSAFGGGLYDINPGAGNRNFGLLGWALTRAVTDRLNLGAEIYHQTPQTTGGRALTAVGFGAVYQLTTHWALLASAGPGLQREKEAGQSAFYVAVELTY